MVPGRFLTWRRLSLHFILVLLVVSTSANHHFKKLREIFTWKSLDFDYPSQEDRTAAINSGSFIPGYLVPIDVDVYTGGKRDVVFVTVPRFQDGVPVTLGYVTDKKNSQGESLIAPYPNWDMQKSGGDCTGITSVYRIAIDSCQRMWILDTGKLIEDQVCPPKLLVYSLKTNTQIRSYTFPKDHYSDASLFITPVVDIRGFCDEPFVYIADVTGFSLIVYDYKNSQSWRIVNNLFYPYPDYGTFEINNESFDLMDGIFGLALGPINRDDRTLYFHSLASRVESRVQTSVIRNQTTFHNHPEASPRSFQSYKHERSSQASAEAMDSNGVLFYGLISDVAIGCWNSKDYAEFGGKSIDKVVTDKKTLQFASGMKVIRPNTGNRQELWVITVSFQKVMTGTLSPNMTNFRIQAGYIDELVRGTKCEVATERVSGINCHIIINRQVSYNCHYKHY